MRISAIALATLLFLVVASLFLAPSFVDLNRLKDPIAATLTERTGRAVRLDGPIGLSLLPTPTITLRGLRMANPPGTAIKDMVRLRAAEVKLALWPLLAGRAEVRSAALIDPELDLERLPDGGTNWRPGAAAPGRSHGAGAPPTAPSGTVAFDLLIDRVDVQNGAITYRSGATIERFEHIAARGALDRAAGTITADGSFVARGAALSFTAQSGRPEAPDLPLQLTVTTRPAARLQLDALLSGSGGDRRLSGTLKFTADDAAAVLATIGRMPVPAVLAQPLSLTGTLGGSLDHMTLDHLGLDLGPAHADGRLEVTPGTPCALAAKLAMSRLDLDHWPPPRRTAALLAIGTARAATSEALPPALPSSAFALPDGVKASLDLGIDAVLWRNDLARDARLKLTLDGGRLALDRFAALLPGGSDISASADLALAPDGPHGQGVIEINADDLRSLLGWIGATADRVPPDRLRKASLSSRVSFEGNRLEFSGMDATLDATRLNGAATVLLRYPPGIGLRLAADRLNLDAYLPQPALPTAAAAAAAPASPGAPASGRGGLDAVNANVDARIEALTWHGQPLNDIHLAGTLENGEITVRELRVGDAAGASGTLSGVIEGFGRDAPKGQLAFDLRGPELERVLRLLSPRLATGHSYGAFSLGGGLQSDGETLAIDSDAELVDGHAHVTGNVGVASGAFDLDLDLDHPSFARLAAVFSPTYRPAGGDPGAVKLTAHLAGKDRRIAADRLSLAIGESQLEGTLGLDTSDPRPKITADLKIGDWAIDRLLSARQNAAIDDGLWHARLLPHVILAQAGASSPSRIPADWSHDPIDWGVLGRADIALKLTGHSLTYGAFRLDEPALTASVTDGALQLAALDGKLFGGAITATGDVSSGAAPTLHAHVALKDGDLGAALADAAGIRWLAGRVDLDASLATTGGSEADLVDQLGGDVAVKAHDGTLAGVDLAAMNAGLNQPGKGQDLISLVRSGAGGRTSFSSLAGNFHITNGVAQSDDLALAADGGSGEASAVIDLRHWTSVTRVGFRLAGATNAPPLVMHLDGPLDAPRIVFDVNELEHYLAQRSPAKAPAAQP